jgi:hypothetical protein
MALTFRIKFLLLLGFILLQAKGLSPGNADVPSALTSRAIFLAEEDFGAPRAIRWRRRPGSGGQDARAPLRAATEGSVGVPPA